MGLSTGTRLAGAEQPNQWLETVQYREAAIAVQIWVTLVRLHMASFGATEGFFAKVSTVDVDR